MRIQSAFILLFLLSNGIGLAEKPSFQLKHIGQFKLIKDSLPSSINESSGLIFYRNQLWTHNDSGDGSYIYVMDTLGKNIVQTITIDNAQNIDWEDISQDNNNIYIGDFGNNYGQRNLLTIYKVSKKSIPTSGNCHVKAEIIQFSYKDMPLAGVIPLRSSFDCEAMVCYNDTLVIISKNWNAPYCNIYFIPAKSGKYIVSPATTLHLDGLITSATLSPNNSNLVLLGYKDYVPFLFVIKHFNLQNINIHKAIYKLFDLNIGYQTEGIAFSTPSKVFISSEMHKYRPNSLFTVNFDSK